MLDSVNGYKGIDVDLASMRALSKRIHSDSDKMTQLVEKLEETIRELGKDWEDDNYARFVMYFAERYSRMDSYGEFLQYQADWLDGAIPIYEEIPTEIQTNVDKCLNRFGI